MVDVIIFYVVCNIGLIIYKMSRMVYLRIYKHYNMKKYKELK
jgi:hypothetical protein